MIPRVTFTHPEVGAVGLQSKDVIGGHRIVTRDHEHVDRAVTESKTDGYTQLVVDKRGRVLGGTVVGPRAGETLGEISLAVKNRLTTSDIAGTTHAYPTYNDGLWNVAVADMRHRLNSGLVLSATRILRRLRSARLRLDREQGWASAQRPVAGENPLDGVDIHENGPDDRDLPG